MIDQLRQSREAEPFCPFRIHLADGTAYAIRTAKDLMLTRAGDIALVDDQDVLHILNHIQVSRASMDRVKRRKGGPAQP